MHRKIAVAAVALALFAGTTTLSFAQNAGGGVESLFRARFFRASCWPESLFGARFFRANYWQHQFDT